MTQKISPKKQPHNTKADYTPVVVAALRATIKLNARGRFGRMQQREIKRPL